jgi:hypothetical protein
MTGALSNIEFWMLPDISALVGGGSDMQICLAQSDPLSQRVLRRLAIRDSQEKA